MSAPRRPETAGAAVLEAATAASRVGRVIVARDGMLLAIDPVAADWLGAAPEALIGKPAWWVGAQLTPGGWAELWDRVAAAGSLVLDGLAQRADGEVVLLGMFLEHQTGPDHAPWLLATMCRKPPRAGEPAASGPPARWYRLVARYSDDAFWDWNLAARRTTVSPQWCAMLGHPPGVEATGDLLRAVVHPDDYPDYIERIRAIVRGETDRIAVVVRMRRADGQVIWVRHRAYAALRGPDGRARRIIGHDVDITAERVAELRLRESEARWRALIERVPVGVIVHGADGQVRLWNEALGRVLGTDAPGVAALFDRWSREGWDLIAENGDRLRLRDMPPFRALATGEAVRDMVVGIGLPDREERRWAMVSAVPSLDAEGRVEDVVTSVADITERRALEEGLARAQRLEGLGRLAGGVAHDFNNLLTAVLGNAEMVLADLPPDGDAADDLRAIVRAARRGASLTRQLLGYARKQPIDPRPVDVGGLLAMAGALVRRLIDAQITVQIEDVPGLWPVRLDPAQFDQLVVNLAVNARDAMPGGGTLSFAPRNVHIDGPSPRWPEARPGDYVLVRVRDTGHGMAPEVIARAFEPFFTTKAPGEGTGLGLAMCYGIARQNGGHIRIASAPGAGTTIEVLLPRCAEDPSEASHELAPIRAERPATVLVVEDDPAVLRMACRTLSNRGYRVWSAADGAEALALLADLEHPPDLVVTDVAMPVVGGPAMVASLRRRWPSLPALFTSGHADRRLAEAGLSPDALDFLQKPYGPDELAARVAALLDGR